MLINPTTNEPISDLYMALDMAIQALSQEPCDDTISREAVKKWVCKTCPDDAECQRDCDVIKGIDALPSVTQKSGKWIHFAQSDDCSLCGYSTGKYGSPSKYCPNCGAKMAESEEV